MSLYADYIREREDLEIIENALGFLTYKIVGQECYLKDIYVSPSERKTGLATEMANRVANIARERGCTYLTGTICPTAKGSDDSLKVLMAYGMKLHSSTTNLIIFKKDII